MSKIPGFNSFERYVMSLIEGVREAKEAGKWKMLILYLFVIIVIAIVSIFISFGAFVGGLEAIGLIRDNINAPRETLSYSKESEKVLENGQYEAVFKLKQSTPVSSAGKMNLISYPLGCDFDNRKEIISGSTEFKNRTMYISDEFKITCITDTQLTEGAYRRLLFELKD